MNYWDGIFGQVINHTQRQHPMLHEHANCAGTEATSTAGIDRDC
jgi:hypothetical protein